MGDSNNTLTVSTELGNVVVHKMHLSDYAELLRSIQALPKALQEYVKGKSEVEIKAININSLLPALPGIIADAWPDFVAILAVSTDKDRDFLLECDGPDAIDIIDAILELNDIARIMAAVKKMQARLAKMAPEKTEARN